MNDVIASLILQLAARLEDITKDLRDNVKTVDEWQADFLRLLAQYMMLGMMRGVNSSDLTLEQEQRIAAALRNQSGYLNRFADEIRETGWQDKYLYRAETYAESIDPLYQQGKTWTLRLPAYPRDGSSECLWNCGCRWEIQWTDQAQGNARAYWIRGKDDSCPTCIEREIKWNPLRFENGVAQNA